jgi:hypothetical protein
MIRTLIITEDTNPAPGMTRYWLEADSGRPDLEKRSRTMRNMTKVEYEFLRWILKEGEGDEGR